MQGVDKMTEAHIGKRTKMKDAPAWLRTLGRIGLTALGIVYLGIGVLALETALGIGGVITGAEGALNHLANEPFGIPMLYVVSCGLVVFALYRIIGGFYDVDANGHDAKAIVGRVGFALSGLGFGLLGGSILRYGVFGSGAQQATQQSGQQHEWTARLMMEPFGRWIIGGIGVWILVFTGYNLHKAITRRFLNVFNTAAMDRATIERASIIGLIGLLARTVILGLMSWFFINAALTFDPDKTGGLDRSLSTLAAQPYGRILLGIVSAGVVAYAIFLFYLARYRHFAKPRSKQPQAAIDAKEGKNKQDKDRPHAGQAVSSG